MQFDHLTVIRQTKLDVAQWITNGISGCQNPSTSRRLARYAAAQLESAACIPFQRSAPGKNGSLLRRELGAHNAHSRRSEDVLARVSRAMMITLARHGRSDEISRQLIRHEAAASREIRGLSRG